MAIGKLEQWELKYDKGLASPVTEGKAFAALKVLHQHARNDQEFIDQVDMLGLSGFLAS